MTYFDQAAANSEAKPLRDFAEKAYLNYSMYVILDRALPHIGDGLKPVQRRIIYAMSELGLAATAKHKKSVRTVGDVIGKYHPHGDVACYEAMVLMAQEFSYRYPLVDGQGNFGAMDDPKSFAAMRYTESRLSRYSELLLDEIDLGTVDWGPNFDGTLDEPLALPARLPNLLLNGATGIAVGMATDIPPHNIREVANAVVHLLDNPNADLESVCDILPGPDFPTGAEIITPRNEILEMYRTGGGSVRVRAVYSMEDGDVVITALPYQVSGAKVLEQIAALMQAKKLPWVADLRDESDHENPIRLVIVPRSNRVDIDDLMSHLFAATDLERSYRINLNVIGLDGRPQVKGLVTILKEWIEFRAQVVKRRLEYRLDKVLTRLHILEGLLIAFLNLDEVIHIIRHEDNPKQVLMQKFSLSEVQVEAILELKLRQLARLEENKIKAEQEKLAAEKTELEALLGSAKKMFALIRKEILADAKEYGDARRSAFVARASAQPIKEIEIIPSEPVTVVLSTMGWIRAAKGHDIDAAALSYRAGDSLQMTARGRSNQQAVFLDTTGRSYSLLANSLPQARGHGEPLTSRISPPAEAGFVGVLAGDPEQMVVLASEQGYGFVCKLDDLYSKNRSGKASLTLAEKVKPLVPQLVGNLETDYLAVATNAGHMLIIKLSSLPTLAKGKGNKIINIPKELFAKHEEYVVDMVVISATSTVIVEGGKRQLKLKPSDLENYHGERGQRGKKLPRAFQRIEKLLTTE